MPPQRHNTMITNQSSQYSKLVNEIKQLIVVTPLINISTDSRECDANTIFVALTGHTVDGRDYIQQVLHNGTKVVFIEKRASAHTLVNSLFSETELADDSLYVHKTVERRELLNEPQATGTVDIFAIDNLQRDLSFISLKFFDYLHILCNPESLGMEVPVIGVTGTNGKTLTSNLIAQGWHALVPNQPVHIMGTIGLGPLGNIRKATNTTPEACTFMREVFSACYDHSSALVCEVSSHGLALNRVRNVRFRQAIFTNLTQDHLDFHHTLEEYFQAKADLFLNHNVIDYIVTCNGTEKDYGARLVKAIARKLASSSEGESAKGLPAYASASLAVGGAVFTADHVAGAENTRPNPLGFSQQANLPQLMDMESKLQRQRFNPRLAIVDISPNGCDFKTLYPADIICRLESATYTPRGIDIKFSLTDKTTQRESTHSFHTSLMGEFNTYNLLTTITSLYLQFEDIDKILVVAEKLQPVSGRMEQIANDLEKTIIVDFCHTPDALEKALHSLKIHFQPTTDEPPVGLTNEQALKQSLQRLGQAAATADEDEVESTTPPSATNANKTSHIWLVFGCGGDRDKGKRPQMGKIAAENADFIVITDDNPRSENPEEIAQEILAGYPNQKTRKLYVPNRHEAIAYAITNSQPHDLILIAGKGHETEQIYGREKQHFSDQEAVRDVLSKLS